MRKALQAIVIVLALLAVAGTGGVIAVHLYLQSPAGQAQIQKELSRVLRMSVTIEKTSLTLSNLQMTGIAIRDGEVNVAKVSTIAASYRIWPLLRGVLSIHDVRIEEPRITWAENGGKPKAAGSKKAKVPKPVAPAVVADSVAPVPAQPVQAVAEVVPQKPVEQEPTKDERAPAKPSVVEEAPAPAIAASVPAEVPGAVDTASPEPSPKIKPAKAAAKKKSWFQVVVEGCQLRGGKVELLDKERRPLASFSDINIDFASRNPDEGAGRVEAGRIVWANSIVFEKVRVPFTFLNGVLDLPEVTATYGDGPFAGTATWRSQDDGAPFTVALKFDQVDLTRLTRDTEEPLGQASGILSASLDLSGSSKDLSRLSGAGKVTVRDGRFRNYAYFDMVGDALGIDELHDIRFQEFSGAVRIAKEHVFIEDLTVNATDLRFEVKGFARFDGKLQVATRLTAAKPVLESMPAAMSDKFIGEGDTRFIDFKVTGKTHKPKSDLPELISGKAPVQSFDELLADILETAKKQSGEMVLKLKASKQSKAPDSGESKDAETSNQGTTAQLARPGAS